MNTLSRSLYGNASNVGRGKSGPMIEKILKAKAKQDKEMEKLKMLYHGVVPKIRKPRVYKKKQVIDPDILAKISEVNVDVVEKALKVFLTEKMKDIVLDIGENGKTVTLDSVLKAIKSVKSENQVVEPKWIPDPNYVQTGIWMDKEKLILNPKYVGTPGMMG